MAGVNRAFREGRIFFGHYRNDPGTRAAIASVDDPRIEPVVDGNGPTKADCFFADGAFTLTRPVYGRFSAGFGMWGGWQGGWQPSIHRVDAGPRISMKVRDNIRVHLDWRQRLSGKAEPGSGPALTLAADF